MKEQISLMPKDDKILWAVFAFALFVVASEYLIARRKGKKIFRFENTIANFSMGMFDRIAGIFMVPLIYFYYYVLYTYVGLFEIPETTAWFFVALLCTDFIWYFYHRAGHRVNLFWGAHIIHHQSEDYNYTVAFNLTPFQVVIRVLFWSAMPILGFTPEVVLGTHLVIGIYQFLLHTPLIPKLGILEKFMVTPSAHRVHHGSNELYLDKNFGGVLIIWDRMFGTYQEEIEEVSYGITKDINSRDFITGVFHYYQNLAYLMKQMPTLKGKLQILYKGPDWAPLLNDLEHMPLYVNKGDYEYKKYTVAQKSYIIGNIVLVILLIPAMSYYITSIPVLGIEVIVAFMMISLVTVGRMMEKNQVLYMEVFKYTIVVLYLTYYLLN